MANDLRKSTNSEILKTCWLRISSERFYWSNSRDVRLLGKGLWLLPFLSPFKHPFIWVTHFSLRSVAWQANLQDISPRVCGALLSKCRPWNLIQVLKFGFRDFVLMLAFLFQLIYWPVLPASTFAPWTRQRLARCSQTNALLQKLRKRNNLFLFRWATVRMRPTVFMNAFPGCFPCFADIQNHKFGFSWIPYQSKLLLVFK